MYVSMLLSRILELEGYEVLKAKDRATALYALKKQEVKVVLCDVFLPDGNGVDMVQELQQLAPEVIYRNVTFRYDIEQLT